MKRVFLPCVLILVGLAVLAWPVTDACAQNKPSRTPPSRPAPTSNVYDVLASHKDLKEFADMLDEAGLKSMLTGTPDEPVTVFAPTNDALDGLSGDVKKRIKAKGNLQSFVKYHIITNSLVSSSAIKGRKASPASANGEELSFDGTSKASPPKVDDADLLQMDINATNGVIHVVSSALVPPSLKVAAVIAEQPKQPTPPAPPLTPAMATSPVAPAAATTTAVSPLAPTTSAAIPSSETTTGAVPEVTPDQPPPTPAPQTNAPASDTGFTLFGHKFGN